MIHDLTTQEGRSHYADAMSGRKRQSEFLEIRTDYMDDKGVIHIDGYKSLDDDEEGVGIGYFIHGEVYWRDAEYQFDPLVKAIVKELKENQNPFVLDNINWKLLKEQKAILVNLNEGNTHYINGTQEDALNGILALLDNIQDYAVDVLGKSEEEVFQFEEEEFNPESGDFFKLLEDYDGFKKGTIVLLGNLQTMEYFDITTEMTTGHSYSAFNLPPSILKEFEPSKANELANVFQRFVANDYKLDKSILNY